MNLKEFLLITFNFISQFTGGHDNLDYIVNHGIGTVFFTILLALAFFQRAESNSYRERLLVWGFGFGLAREVFMILTSYMQALKLLPLDIFHVIIQPLEHGLSNIAMVVIAAAFLRYILKDSPPSRLYLKLSVSSIILCYLIIFLWWTYSGSHNPAAQLQRPWCRWLFRVNASIWMLVPLIWIFIKAKGWTRNTVCIALSCFFFSEFLALPEMAMGGRYEEILTPFRHGLYMIAIPIFGYVYIAEMYMQRQTTLNQLRQSQLTLEAIFQNSIPTCITSTHYEVLHANEAYNSVFGKERRELNKCYHSRPGSLCNTEKCPMKQILGGKKSLTIDATKLDCHGAERYFIITAKPFHNPEGEIVGIVESFQDITSRKKLEEEREEMEMLLRQSQKMKALGTMAGGIAHDFNNILFITIGNAELALDDIPEGNPAREKIDQILKISSRGQDLVKQILTFSRRDSQIMNPHYFQVLIQKIIKMIGPTIPATVELLTEIDNDCPPVLSDSTQISQLLLNLCNNAVHAMDEKGILKISLHNIILGPEDLRDQSNLKPGMHVRLSVSDNGIGMNQKIKERIFEPFFTTKEIGTGTGMGLSVVHGIAKSHQARILVDSEPGKGATFHIDFPVTEQIEASAPDQSIELQGGNEHILFIDDEEALAVMASMTLEQLGYKVTIRTVSLEALELFQTDPSSFDLVITDLAMPKLSGMELAKKMLQIRPDIPIILCTGYSKKITREKALEIGIREFCLKPLYRKQFAMSVRQVLNRQHEAPGNTTDTKQPADK